VIVVVGLRPFDSSSIVAQSLPVHAPTCGLTCTRSHSFATDNRAAVLRFTLGSLPRYKTQMATPLRRKRLHDSKRGIRGPVSPAQLLGEARQFLDRVGWTQGTERDSEDRACLVGALLAVCKAVNGFPYEGLHEPLCLLRQVISASEGEEWHGEPGLAYNELEVWNDDPGRTYADVAELLSAGEQLAREQEQQHHVSELHRSVER